MKAARALLPCGDLVKLKFMTALLLLLAVSGGPAYWRARKTSSRASRLPRSPKKVSRMREG